MRKLILIINLIAFAFAFSACDSNRVYEDYRMIPDYLWNKNQTLHFEVEVTDTIHPHNLYLNVRNTGAYEYSNLWLFIKEKSPKGELKKDKFECRLAKENGRWLGSGFGTIYDLQIPYQQNVIFPNKGTYRIEIVQGMREDVLKEIVNVGIRIEKAK
jgi:gliding motility-associated lipoprotein GldH